MIDYLPILSIVIGFTIAFLLEAQHDHILADKEFLIRQLLRDQIGEINEQQLSKEYWHKKDWQYLAVIALVVALVYPGSWLEKALVPVVISFLRILVFNIRLNALLGNKTFYLSADGFEGKFKKKEKLYYGIALIVLLFSIIVLLWHTF